MADPAFQAAVVLDSSAIGTGGSSYDRSMNKLKLQQTQEKEKRETIEKGLADLGVDLKGWEDQAGFKEIMSDHQAVIDAYLELSKGGLNLVAPKTEQEITAFKAIQDAHKKIVQKVDTWDRNKKQVDAIAMLQQQDLARDPSEQKIDHEKTNANIQNQLGTKGVLDREMNLSKLLVYKPDIGDVVKYTKEYADFMPKPTQVTESYTDPVTGQQGTRLTQKLTPEQVKETEEKLKTRYRTAPDNIKEAVKQQKAKDKTLDVLTDEEYYVAMFSPEYNEKMSNKLSGKSGGLSLNFLGQKTTMEPGKLRDVPLTYGPKTFTSAYQFAGTKPITLNLGAKGSKQFNEEEWTDIEGGGDVEATLVFYDSATDELVFRVGQASQTPYVANNATISVPRANIGDQADELPIMEDGKVVKLKDKFGTKKPIIKSLGVDWSKKAYIPKNVKK